MIRNLINIYLFSRKTAQLSKQIYIKKQNEDSTFKDLLKTDQQQTLKNIDGDNYIPEPKKGDSRLPRIKEQLKETNTHILQEQKLSQAITNLGVKTQMSKAVIKDGIKQEFFLMKKLQEEQIKFEEELKVKKRKHELKDIFQQIQEMDIQPDNQYEDKIPYFNKLTMEEKFEKINEWNKQHSVLGKIDPYLLQRARTSKNIDEFITNYLEDDAKLYDTIGVTTMIKISQIITNKACTVVWIYINFIDIQNEKDKLKIITKLNNQSKQFSWKMCQELGLKYGPDIRFQISKKEEHIEELKKEIDENASQIVTEDLIEKYQAGEIPRYIKKSKFQNIIQELKTKKSYLQDEISNSTIGKEKQTSNSKNIRQKSTPKQSNAEKFWDQL